MYCFLSFFEVLVTVIVVNVLPVIVKNHRGCTGVITKILILFLFVEQGGLQRINRVASHPTLPVTVTAHEDRHLRFYDNRTGNKKPVNELVIGSGQWLIE